jgi:hypothetical protein
MPYLGNTPSTSFATVVKDSFSGDGSTVAFTLSKVATTNSVSVFVENVRQEPTTAYAVSGTTLTFTAAPVTSSGNNIYVLHMNPTTTTTHPAAQNLTAVDGTFTGAFTSKGIDDNADATAITITSDEAVGIGKSLTPNNYSGYQSLTIGGSDATTGATVDLEDSSGNLEGRINGTNGIVYVEADPAGATGSSKISLEVDGTARMTIDSGGDVDIETGDIFFSTAGKGINLGVTSNTDSNTLDDYEEGTFTFGSNANVAFQSNTNVGRYTKIGNMVHLQLHLDLSSTSSTNHFYLSGLPFTSGSHTTNTYNGQSTGTCMIYNVDTYWSGSQFCSYIGQGSTNMYFYETYDNSNWSIVTNARISNSAEIIISHTYFV